MTRGGRHGVAIAIAIAALIVSACTSSETATRTQPKLLPPIIKKQGVLRVGVDLSYPPFGGVDKAERAGIDVDVASALAARFGLDVRLVDVKASDVATALANGDVDVALSVPFSSDVVSRVSMTGTYLSDGPALFSSDVGGSTATTTSILAADNAKIGAQEGSEAYWQLLGDLGPDAVVAYPTLRDAFEALDQKEVSAVGGDALVGAYIARDLTGVRYVGAIAPAHLLGAAVAEDNSELSDATRGQLDQLLADGTINAIRAAWVGQLPKLPLPSVDVSRTAPSEISTP